MITQNDINAKIMTQNNDTQILTQTMLYVFCVIIINTKRVEFDIMPKIITQINNTQKINTN